MIFEIINLNGSFGSETGTFYEPKLIIVSNPNIQIGKFKKSHKKTLGLMPTNDLE